ncbi:MAG: hypothetical protein QXQ14_02245 [Candidatus Aenigmatarchaeota archaeon]
MIICEKVAFEFLPSIRALIARTLFEKYKLSQTQIAKILGVSQASVSYYIYELRGVKLKELEKREIKIKVDEICEKIVNNELSKNDLHKEICKLAQEFYKNALIPCKF